MMLDFVLQRDVGRDTQSLRQLTHFFDPNDSFKFMQTDGSGRYLVLKIRSQRVLI